MAFGPNVFLIPPFVLGTGKPGCNGSTQGEVSELELNWKEICNGYIENKIP